MKNSSKLLYLAVCSSLFTPLVANAAASNSPERTVSALASGVVMIPQTEASVQLSISQNDSDAKDAQQEVRVKADKLLKALKANKILSIQTTDISVNPIWSYANNTSKVTGYTASYGVKVKALIPEIGNVIDTAVSNGVNVVSTPQFSASDSARASAELVAIKQATILARQRADTALSALGLKEQSIKQITIQNTSPNPTPPVHFALMRASANDSAEAPATTVDSGQEQVKAEVSLVITY